MNQYSNVGQHYAVIDPQSQIDKKEACLEVQHDPYEYLQSNWEMQMNKQMPVRMFLIGTFVGASSLYYLSRNAEIKRIRQLKFSVDMIFNVAARGLVAAVAGDLIGRKLFVNYRRIQQHKVAKNEVSKIMRTMPNARQYLMPHQRPNSYYYAMKQ